MADYEQIEKLRQEIMRFRELLDIMSANLHDGEAAYARLFAAFSAEEIAATKEKDLQWKAAEQLTSQPQALARPVLTMRFHARELERAFEELYGVIVTDTAAG